MLFNLEDRRFRILRQRLSGGGDSVMVSSGGDWSELIPGQLNLISLQLQNSIVVVGFPIPYLAFLKKTILPQGGRQRDITS